MSETDDKVNNLEIEVFQLRKKVLPTKIVWFFIGFVSAMALIGFLSDALR